MVPINGLTYKERSDHGKKVDCGVGYELLSYYFIFFFILFAHIARCDRPIYKFMLVHIWKVFVVGVQKLLKSDLTEDVEGEDQEPDELLVFLEEEFDDHLQCSDLVQAKVTFI